jgi:aldose 1-epimerase
MSHVAPVPAPDQSASTGVAASSICAAAWHPGDLIGGHTGVMLELNAGDATAIVSPSDGGRVARLCVGGTELLVRGTGADHPMMWGSFPMAPYAGRVRNARFEFRGATVELEPSLAPHAIHGTAFTTAWDVLDDGPDHAELSCRLSWPLGGMAHQHLQLTAGALVCVLTVVAGDRPLPAVLGWHPWFVRPAHDRLGFGAMYERGSDGLPTGRTVSPSPRPWDDCFVDPVSPLVLDYGHLLVTVSSDADHWVVYDEPAHAICIEPQSGPPDAFNIGGAAVLEPGEFVQRMMTIAWT